jgi:L-ascorbate metabolism protein UlaG (beta-lactamase superfamily)
MRLKLGRPDIDRYTARFDVPAADGGFAVTFLGVATLLFDDGESAVLFDGFFSRPSLLEVGLKKIAPKDDRIDAALTRVGFGRDSGRRLGAVVPVHSHYDHAMDSAAVAERTGAVLVGGESTANVGRGGGLPADRIQVVAHGEQATYGAFTLTFLVSDHCPPDRFPGTIDAPVTPPVKVGAYACGEAWSVIVTHTSGRTALVQGSAGFVPKALTGRSADVAYLGIGQLGVQSEDYLRTYWAETVETIGATRVVLTHWDDFFRPLDEPLRALPYMGDDLDVTMRVLGQLADEQGVALHLPNVWRREDAWAELPRQDG